MKEFKKRMHHRPHERWVTNKVTSGGQMTWLRVRKREIDRGNKDGDV